MASKRNTPLANVFWDYCVNVAWRHLHWHSVDNLAFRVSGLIDSPEG